MASVAQSFSNSSLGSSAGGLGAGAGAGAVQGAAQGAASRGAAPPFAPALRAPLALLPRIGLHVAAGRVWRRLAPLTAQAPAAAGGPAPAIPPMHLLLDVQLDAPVGAAEPTPCGVLATQAPPRPCLPAVACLPAFLPSQGTW
jgi:hypothetical protein